MTTKGYGGTVKEKRCGKVIGGGHRRTKELRQRKRFAQLLPVCAAAALAAATISARADVLSEMQRFWDGAAVNTTGPTAFDLALETISPVIAETMSKLRALAQWVNNQSINSCEMAQSLVGAAWSTNDRASASICAAIGTSQGIFSDYAAARHGCGSGGKRYSTLAAATGELADQAPVNVNYAWEAVQGSAFLSADQALGEFAMSITGTIIVTAPVTDGSTVPPAVRVLEPLALDREVTEILMEGGGDLPVYTCDTPLQCLNPTLGRVNIPADRGLRARVAGLMRDLVDARQR